jgi:integrase
VNISKAWLRIRQAAGIEDVRLHDLRRTTGSWMTQAGVDLDVIKDALRHANLSTTLTYARLGEDVAREPMEEHGRRILEAAGRRGPAGVLGPVSKGT